MLPPRPQIVRIPTRHFKLKQHQESAHSQNRLPRCEQIYPIRKRLGTVEYYRVSLRLPSRLHTSISFAPCSSKGPGVKDAVGSVGAETTINTSDLAGILMIAVQALESRTAALADLTTENADLKERVEELERTIKKRT